MMKELLKRIICSASQTREREIAGLLEAMTTYQLTEGYIITMEEKEEINMQGLVIRVLPAWEWMLGGLKVSLHVRLCKSLFEGLRLLFV